MDIDTFIVECDYSLASGGVIEGFFLSTPAYINIFGQAQKYSSLKKELAKKDALFAQTIEEAESLTREVKAYEFQVDVLQVKLESSEKQKSLYKTGFWVAVGTAGGLVLLNEVIRAFGGKVYLFPGD